MMSSTRMEPINPESLGAPRGYSNGMLAPGGGRLLFIAGQVAWDSDQQVVSDEFVVQFAQALSNVLEVVRTAGGTPEDIGQLTIYVTDKAEYLGSGRKLGESYRLLMGQHYPTMALVEIAALVDDRAKVEISGLAVVQSEEEAVMEATGTAPGTVTVGDFPAAVSKKGA